MFIFSIVVFLAALCYVCRREWTLLPLPVSARVAIVALTVALTLGLLLYFAVQRKWPLWASSALYRVSTSWIFIFLYIVMGLLLLDVVRLLVPAVRPYMGTSWLPPACLAVALVAVFAAGNAKYYRKVRVPLDVKTDKPLPRPLRIVMVSDLHLGYCIGNGEVGGWVERINAERPDLILIAGDLVDGSPRPLAQGQMWVPLRRLSARLGVFACLGNHEYIGGRKASEDFIARTGIRLLRDTAVCLPQAGVCIAGRDDRSNPRRKSVEQLVAPLDAGKNIILLDHQPYSLDEAQRAGVDLQLSGHTHSGQVFPINLIVDAIYEQAHGYLRKGRSQYYVSSGLGIWGGKFRIGTQSEYVVINLHN